MSSNSSDFIGAHEFGHLTGVPDEYPDQDGNTSVRHIKPDGSLGEHVMLATWELNSPAASVMSTKDSFKRFPHHFWNIAIEVQELLSAKFGREVTCAII